MTDLLVAIIDFLRELPAFFDGHVWIVQGFTGWAWDCQRAAECYMGLTPGCESRR